MHSQASAHTPREQSPSYYSRTPAQVWNESFASHLVDRQNAWLLVRLRSGGFVTEASVKETPPTPPIKLQNTALKLHCYCSDYSCHKYIIILLWLQIWLLQAKYKYRRYTYFLLYSSFPFCSPSLPSLLAPWSSSKVRQVHVAYSCMLFNNKAIRSAWYKT